MHGMIGRETLERYLDYPSLVAAIRAAFTNPPITPDRQVITIEEMPGQPAGTLLVMPAVRPGGLIGVKLVTIHPSLSNRKGGAVRAAYVALDSATGEMRGIVDGHALTLRRTAATSVLAAGLSCRPDPRNLLVVGTGQVCRALAEAYAVTLRPRNIRIWGRRTEAAERLAEELAAVQIPAEPVSDLAKATRWADIITSATLSETPLILDENVRNGAHVDLVGGFAPHMREADDDLLARARVIVDVEKTLSEAGDIVQPLSAGRIRADDVALLGDILAGDDPPGWRPDRVTLFKSCGHALEDMAAVELLFSRYDPDGAEAGQSGSSM